MFPGKGQDQETDRGGHDQGQDEHQEGHRVGHDQGDLGPDPNKW